MRTPTVQLNSVNAIYNVFLQRKQFSDRIRLYKFFHFASKGAFTCELGDEMGNYVLIFGW
jgi:hypothetical protein